MDTNVITSSPDVLGGTPVFAGTQAPVRTLLELLEAGETINDFLLRFPAVRRDQVLAVLEQAKRNLLPSLIGVEQSPGVCGGVSCIVGTRIPIWTLEAMRREKLIEADILSSFPSLRAEDLVNAWRFVDSHQSEIDVQIQENEEA